MNHNLHNEKEIRYFTPGDSLDKKYLQDIESKKNFWLLGANWDNQDMTDQFIADNRWENGYTDKYSEEVNSVKEGDFVAIKSSYTQKNNLPFDNKNKPVSVMKIKAIGKVVKNKNDGKNLVVKWDKSFKSKELYIYAYRKTISKIDYHRWPEVAHWIFYGYDQAPEFLKKESMKSNKLVLEKYIERAKNIFKKKFPSFIDFEKPGVEYLEEEYDYKKEMFLESKKYFEQMTESNFQFIIKKALKPTNESNLFNWRDIEEFTQLSQENQNRLVVLTQKLINVLEENQLNDEFDSIIDLISSIITKKSVAWLYATYVLSVFDSKKHMAMKSSFIDQAMKFFDKEPIARGRTITYKSYKMALDLVYEVETLIEDWKPRNLIDIHSFLWVVTQNMDRTTNNRHKREEGETMKLNTILYGPPGTGKTYHTIDRALQIIDGEVPESREEAKARFETLKEAGQIEFVTFHQSYGYEEFVEGIKADVESENIQYSIEDGVFKRLSQTARRNYLKSTQNNQVKKEFETVFKEKILDKMHDDKLKINMSKKYFYITDVTDRTIFFEKASGNTSHSLSIKSLKKMYELGKNDFLLGGLAVYYQPLLEMLLEDSIEKDETEIQKNYLLIIDEINRGNISKIFGELITLIEESKRLGNKEAMEVTLPYSGEKFGVPGNLYIIGTMNTADRSIALMDTALRRRFEFV